MELIDFNTAIEEGEITHKDGYHKPNDYPHHMRGCGCEKTTPKGAYRDVSVEMNDGTVVHFYHQTPVVIYKNGKYKINNGGYETSTTKERINRYLPTGFKVIQRDYTWYLETYDPSVPYPERETERKEYENGMIIQA